ncbi:MAG: hypothetical protein JRN34_04980 [Nitrososphaerota archaeon]|nr:hypothetical protein [Nitrososphaerota archaeon]MDG6942262.1 hypothetical protein [Nitrososphaerota archaeon]MDG6942727.1 hypothetical protein [Nitrososphaerota archaeon]MDG6948514.1 hypothetical protein [Nitrososphaerota archaeon]MDG6950440.1 hypothetical protein [Nitrososphaerota archaeon]
MERENTSEDSLADIKNLVDDIKALLFLTNQDRLEEVKKRLLKPGTVETQVYQLCEERKTTQDIAAAIQKTVEYAGAVISTLRRKGLIRTIEVDGKKFHEQRF